MPGPAGTGQEYDVRKTLDFYIGQTLNFGWNENHVDNIFKCLMTLEFHVV